MKAKKNIFSYQARIHADSDVVSALDAYAGLYGKIERKLYAESFSNNKNPSAFKNEYLKRFGIGARMFNALRIGLEGKVSSIIERRENLISEAETRIKKKASRYFCESLFWASQPKQAAKDYATVYFAPQAPIRPFHSLRPNKGIVASFQLT